MLLRSVGPSMPSIGARPKSIPSPFFSRFFCHFSEGEGQGRCTWKNPRTCGWSHDFFFIFYGWAWTWRVDARGARRDSALGIRFVDASQVQLAAPSRVRQSWVSRVDVVHQHVPQHAVQGAQRRTCHHLIRRVVAQVHTRVRHPRPCWCAQAQDPRFHARQGRRAQAHPRVSGQEEHQRRVRRRETEGMAHVQRMATGRPGLSHQQLERRAHHLVEAHAHEDERRLQLSTRRHPTGVERHPRHWYQRHVRQHLRPRVVRSVAHAHLSHRTQRGHVRRHRTSRARARPRTETDEWTRRRTDAQHTSAYGSARGRARAFRDGTRDVATWRGIRRTSGTTSASETTR
mmetsp:Transcript_3236/g.20090  ORF Transcript_3236/g.20090 Transcript_3236/m.20090 type:complete len:344 (+) Transcript_3236:4374-5405(+)